jgi:hypothetical protein
VTADLDRLELELRGVPGVIAIGFDRDTGRGLLIHVVGLSSTAADDLRDQVRRIVDANLRDGVRLDIVVDRDESSRSTGSPDVSPRAATR